MDPYSVCCGAVLGAAAFWLLYDPRKSKEYKDLREKAEERLAERRAAYKIERPGRYELPNVDVRVLAYDAAAIWDRSQDEPVVRHTLTLIKRGYEAPQDIA